MLSPIRANGCNITKEELIARNYDIFVNCPLCSDLGVECRVGSHPTSVQPTGKFHSLFAALKIILFTISIVMDDFKRNSCGEMRMCANYNVSLTWVRVG